MRHAGVGGASCGGRWRRWALVVATFVVAAGAVALVPVAGGAATKGAEGVWSVTNTNAPADTYTIVREGSGETYTITNAYGFTATGVGIPSSGGAATARFTSPGTPEYFIMKLTFKFPADGPATFRGTWNEYSSNGGVILSGTDRGVRGAAPQADHLKIAFDPATVGAQGTGVSTATITDQDDSGAPVANATIHIEPPLIYGENKPPALVCDDAARLVSPTRQVGGALEGFSFDRTTDSAGQVHLTVFTGAVGGEWPLDALEKSKPGTDRVFAGLNVVPAGGSSQLPAELTSLLAAAADTSLADFSGSAQRTALAWLGRLAGPSGALQGVAFAPIYAVDAVGTTNAGVVLFANAPAVRKQVLDYLTAGGPAPSDLQAVVIDAKLMRVLLLGTRLAGSQVNAPPYRLPALDEWANGGFITIENKELQSRNKDTKIPVPAHGQPRFGLVGASGYEDLLYGYGPVPPFAANAAVQAQFSRCVGTSLGTSVVPHSPVAIQALGPGGHAAGIDGHGKAIDTIPDAIVNYRGSKLTSLQLPRGTFRLRVTGTGTGSATIVITVPAAGGVQTRVFRFGVRRGEVGTIALGPATAAATMRWGGRTVRASKGVRLTARGLPSVMRHGRVTQLRLKVVDQFGKPAAGVSLRVSGRPLAHRVTAVSSRSGALVVPIDAVRRGSLRVRLSGLGFATLTRPLAIR